MYTVELHLYRVVTLKLFLAKTLSFVIRKYKLLLYFKELFGYLGQDEITKDGWGWGWCSTWNCVLYELSNLQKNIHVDFEQYLNRFYELRVHT
jgi:hypothetical protein